MKKFTFIIGLILIAAALVAAGWWLGGRERYLADAYATSTVDKLLAEASVKALILHQLDAGNTGEARQLLRLELDGEILVLDSLLDSADARNRDLARKVFARMASYRAEYPSNYTAQMPEADAKIAEILRGGTQVQKK
jgi:hypothetical protein